MRSLFFLLFFIVTHWSFSQQVADTTYTPLIKNSLYLTGNGPVVFIDEGHHNFHTKNGRYKSFSNLLERDGYKVKAFKGTFKKSELSKGTILVISNALHKTNIRNWSLPNPSAFTKTEIEAVKTWVGNGGSLFLIADHMPMAGAAKDLAKSFGFEFSNGFVLDTVKRGPAYFNLKKGTLSKNPITTGRNDSESVQEVVTFTGQAFKIPSDATSILTFKKGFVNLLPKQAWVFDETTKVRNPKGWSQGAYKKFGKGRIVVFGEAAMFSAQIAGPKKIRMGMNNPIAPQNYQLLLNIIHWLDGTLP